MNEDTNAQPGTATEAPRREPSPGPNPANRKPTKAPAPKGKTAKKAAPKPKKAAKAKSGEKSSTALLAEKAKEYHRDTKVKTPSGAASVDCNDKTAKALRGATLDDVYKAASKALRELEADLRKKYRHLNPGMQRMNLGNRMRAAQ